MATTHTLTLTLPQSHALTRLLKHLHTAWLDLSGESTAREEEPLFSPLDLETLLPLLRELDEKKSLTASHYGESLSDLLQ